MFNTKHLSKMTAQELQNARTECLEAVKQHKYNADTTRSRIEREYFQDKVIQWGDDLALIQDEIARRAATPAEPVSQPSAQDESDETHHESRETMPVYQSNDLDQELADTQLSHESERDYTNDDSDLFPAKPTEAEFFARLQDVIIEAQGRGGNRIKRFVTGVENVTEDEINELVRLGYAYHSKIDGWCWLTQKGEDFRKDDSVPVTSDQTPAPSMHASTLSVLEDDPPALRDWKRDRNAIHATLDRAGVARAEGAVCDDPNCNSLTHHRVHTLIADRDAIATQLAAANAEIARLRERSRINASKLDRIRDEVMQYPMNEPAEKLVNALYEILHDLMIERD